MPHHAVVRCRSFAFTLCLAAATAATAARADEFSDYRIPDHRLLLANASVLLDLADNRATNRWGTSRGASGFTNVVTSGSWTRASETCRSWIDWNGAFQGDRGHADVTQFMRTEQSHAAHSNEHAFGSLGAAADPAHVPIGYDALVLASLVWEQDWDAAHVRDGQFATDGLYALESQDATHRWAETRSVEARAGVHVGRVRDATAVAEAHLLERRLLRYGVLTRPLGPDARRRLAQLADVANDLVAAHDRPARHVWAEVERVLRDDGALRDTIGAGVLAAQEPWVGAGSDPRGIPRSPIGRDVGWSVMPYVAMQHMWSASDFRQTYFQQVARNDTVQSSTGFVTDHADHHSTDLPAVGIRFEYHRPLGESWQVDAMTDAQRPVDRDRDRAFTVSSLVALSTVVADRLVWNVTASQFRQIFESRDLDYDTWTTGVRTTLQFYIEDHVALTLTAMSTQSQFELNHQQRGSVRVGIDYRLARRFRAAGIVNEEAMWP